MPQTRSDEYAASVAQQRLDMQFQQIDGLDAKATALLGFTGVVLALLFTSATVNENWDPAFTVSAVAFSLGVLALGFAVFPRGFKYNPSVSALYRWRRFNRATCATLVTRSIQAAMAHNRHHIDRKLRGVQAGAGLIIIGVVALAIGLLGSAHGEPKNRTHDVEATINSERQGVERYDRAFRTRIGGERRGSARTH